MLNKAGLLTKGDWILTGGFPCQDISMAGKGAGLEGGRSGLWFEYARLIGELRPKFAVVENVGAITIRGLNRVLGSLAEIGYNAEWQDIRARDMGAPHKRERIWIVAYPDSEGLERYRRMGTEKSPFSYFGGCGTLAYSRGNRSFQRNGELFEDQSSCETGADNRRRTPLDAIRQWWEAEPGVDRVAYGIPRRVDRLRGLGNSIVPQIAMLIFMTIKPYFYGFED